MRFLFFFSNVQNRKKYDRKKFQWLYSDYSCDEFFAKNFDCKNFPIQVSCHFHKYFPVQNNSSLQYPSRYQVVSEQRGVIQVPLSTSFPRKFIRLCFHATTQALRSCLLVQRANVILYFTSNLNCDISQNCSWWI